MEDMIDRLLRGDSGDEPKGGVGGFVEQLLRERDEAQAPDHRDITFSIRMTETERQLLDNLARHFNWKKTPLAQVLLTEAMYEAARRVALHEAAGDPEEAREIFLALLEPPYDYGDANGRGEAR